MQEIETKQVKIMVPFVGVMLKLHGIIIAFRTFNVKGFMLTIGPHPCYKNVLIGCDIWAYFILCEQVTISLIFPRPDRYIWIAMRCGYARVTTAKKGVLP